MPVLRNGGGVLYLQFRSFRSSAGEMEILNGILPLKFRWGKKNVDFGSDVFLLCNFYCLINEWGFVVS